MTTEITINYLKQLLPKLTITADLFGAAYITHPQDRYCTTIDIKSLDLTNDHTTLQTLHKQLTEKTSIVMDMTIYYLRKEIELKLK